MRAQSRAPLNLRGAIEPNRRVSAHGTCPPTRGARPTNETAVDVRLSRQTAVDAMREHSCSWITSFPLRDAVATRLRISGCSAERITACTPDNALEHCTLPRRLPSSGRAHRSLETAVALLRDQRLVRVQKTSSGQGWSPSIGVPPIATRSTTRTSSSEPTTVRRPSPKRGTESPLSPPRRNTSKDV